MAPRIYDAYYDDRFADLREPLIKVIRANIDSVADDISRAVEWLEAEYSEESTREWWEQKQRLNRARDSGTPGLNPHPHQAVKTKMPVDQMSALRLERVIGRFLTMNQDGRPDRLLGRNIPKETRRLNALCVVVAGACIIDPDAGEWLSPITALADAPWQSDASSDPPVEGRIRVFGRYGYDALWMVLEACHVLGWGRQTDESESIRPAQQEGNLEKGDVSAESPKDSQPDAQIEVLATGVDQGQQVLPPPLTKCMRLVLAALREIGPEIPASANRVVEAMPREEAYGEVTTRQAIKELEGLGYVERPNGPRQGVRLTIKGLRVASRLTE